MRPFRQDRWDLEELVKDQDSPAFRRQLGEIESKVKAFEKNRGNLSSRMSAMRFITILKSLEEITERFSVVSGYASLEYSSDTQSDRATSLLTRMSKIGSEIDNRTLFFDQWWKKYLDEGNARRLMKNAGDLQEFLRHKRTLARYSLSEPEEKIINTLDVTGHSALVKLYDKITNAFQFKVRINGKERTCTREELSQFVRSPVAKTRRHAYEVLLSQFDSHKGVLGEIYQNIVQNWRDECVQIRGYESPISVRNIGNDVDDMTVESLIHVCRRNADVFRKFFALKARLLKIEKLWRYDIYAPMPKKEEKRHTYDSAVRMVLETLHDFSPRLGEMARRVFVENHVDSQIRHGKRSGAFCSTIGPKITPFVLLNFKGKSNDVFTMAHELGHAIHSMSASGKSIFIQEAPLPLAETASTFSEMLLFDKILNHVSQKEQQSILLEHIDDLYATVGRQAFFTIFEIAAHEKIGKGATVKDLSEVYMASLREQFGSSVKMTPDFAIEWTCIPHFFHSPFYCYSYSFGNLLSLSLFQQYKTEGSSFVPTYEAILSSGGAKKPEKLLKENGVDITTERFWQDGFNYIKNQTKRLENVLD